MREYVFNHKSQEHCYGCRACEQICPPKAIAMQINGEGFVFPFIDTNKCINCDLCEKNCPVITENAEKIKYDKPLNVYAAWSKNFNTVMQSTSGGLFFLMATQIINSGGVVYGCIWENENLHAIHKRITNLKELEKVRGSKYIQSSTENTFKQVKEDLKNNLIVLYSGVPCQIAGLRLFLRKEYANLLTIDLVCHGTPSPKIFSAYIADKEKEEKARIVDFKFRAKKKSGWRSYVHYSLSNKKNKIHTAGFESYMYGFYSGIISRESCYTCEFSCAERVGDITLSDFWGGERYHKELKKQRKYGFNLVMCNTDKGVNLLESISEQIHLIPSTLEYAKSGDIRLRQSERRPSRRDDIYELLDQKGYSYLKETVLRPSYYLVRKLIPDRFKNIIQEIKSRT